jgi:hypothetical protein
VKQDKRRGTLSMSKNTEQELADHLQQAAADFLGVDGETGEVLLELTMSVKVQEADATVSRHHDDMSDEMLAALAAADEAGVVVSIQPGRIDIEPPTTRGTCGCDASQADSHH